MKKRCGSFVSTTPYSRHFDLLATREHNRHGGGCPSLRPAAGPRRKAANDTVVSFLVSVIGPQRNDEELSNPVPKEPVMFLKPTSSFLHAGVATVAVEIPEPLESLHHKVKLAVDPWCFLDSYVDAECKDYRERSIGSRICSCYA
uniref:Uncharacterized protein n=1 Tax=Zea mays TaxID=4577 RepID=A0A804NLW7_MAIZE